MKIILIGKAEGWWNAPREGETWGIHSLCLKREVKMVWDMHKIEINEGCEPKQQQMIIDYVNEDKVPYMTLKKHDDIPTSMAFPIEEMELKYSESSISYMVWYAIHIGATEIDLYGILMAAFDEYHEQLKSVEYWIGYARGKGIKVTIHEPTAICKGRQGLYGYDFVNEPTPMGSCYKKKNDPDPDALYVLQRWRQGAQV